MFRFPAYFILIFVGLSVLIAYFINRWQTEQEQDLGSQSAPIVRGLASILTSEIQFENPQSCGKDRNYLQEGLAKIPSLYRDPRARRPAEFPRDCMTYILRKSFAGQGESRPCVTANYVNSIYNSFGDFTTCFAIPQRELLPLLLHEGGVKTVFADYQAEILSSHDEACQRLAILPSQNPLLPLLSWMMKYKQDRKEIEKSLQDTELDIIARLRARGLNEKDYEREQLVQMMSILAFRMGARGAVLSLKGYLDLMASMKRQLTLSDFSFEDDETLDFKNKPTFQAYLMSYQAAGQDRYFSSIKRAANELKEAVKGGVCVPDSYLSL